MGTDDRRARPSDREPAPSIVIITKASGTPIEDALTVLRSVASSVEEYEDYPDLATLKFTGASQQTIRESMERLGFSPSIVRRDVYESRAVAVHWVSRMLQESVSNVGDHAWQMLSPSTPSAIQLNPPRLPNGVRELLSKALVSAFPTVVQLRRVFLLWITEPIAINTEGRTDLSALYGDIVDLLQEKGRLDDFLCGAARQNDGNYALSPCFLTNWLTAIGAASVERQPIVHSSANRPSESVEGRCTATRPPARLDGLRAATCAPPPGDGGTEPAKQAGDQRWTLDPVFRCTTGRGAEKYVTCVTYFR